MSGIVQDNRIRLSRKSYFVDRYDIVTSNSQYFDKNLGEGVFIDE